MQSTPIRIGTRGSPLALAQANMVRDRLAAALGLAPDEFVIEVIRTTGDSILDRPLSDAGGKGLFTKEIDDALLSGAVDIAVHSAKDVPTVLPDGIVIAATLERADVRDAFLAPKAARFADLPQGATLGTSSLRRKAMALRLRPDLKVVDFRGNVGTRIRKLEEGVADATLLAAAGLARLGLLDRAQSLIPVDDWLPAPGQGIIAIAARTGDDRSRERLATIADADSGAALSAERAFLAVLDGSCRTPIAGYAETAGGALRFRGLIVRPDGSAAHGVVREGAPDDAQAIGADAGAEAARRGGPEFFSGA